MIDTKLLAIVEEVTQLELFEDLFFGWPETLGQRYDDIQSRERVIQNIVPEILGDTDGDGEALTRRSVRELVRRNVRPNQEGWRAAYIQSCNELIRVATHPTLVSSLLATLLASVAENAAEEDIQRLLFEWTYPR